VAGAKVTGKNVATGLERSTVTSDDGSYSLPELPIGTYNVTIEKSGFQSAVTNNVAVDVASQKRVDAVVKPGEMTQQVVVSAETLPQVETTSDTLGGSFQSEQVLSLPINGRDYTKMLIMVPGANGEPNGGGDSPGSFGLFSANGNRGRANNFLLDGTDMNDGYRNLPAINQGGVFGTPGTVLPLDSIAELRVLSDFDAEYGRNSGSVVNIVTKSGTNEMHGSVSEYFRNDHLNARNYFNTSDQSANAFRNNQFGGAIGGPVVKNKTFYYLAYEGQREGLAITSLNVVPSLSDFAAAMADPSVGGDPSKCTTTIFTCVTTQNAGVVNQVTLNLFNFCNQSGKCSGRKDVWPAVNILGAAPGAPNSSDPAGAFNNADSFLVKLDQTINANNQLTGRYFFGNSDQSFPLGLAGGNNLPNTNTEAPIRTQLVSVSYVRQISATQVNEARFGWNRYRNGFFAADRGVFGDPNASLGLNNGVTNSRDFGLPTIRFGFVSALGSSPFSNPRNRVDTNWQGIDNFSWKLNRNDIKFGYEFHRTAVDSFNDFSARGVLVFNLLTDFLEATPASSVLFSSRIITNNTDRKARQNSNGMYVDDTIRLTDRLTADLGVRWDYFGVIHEANNLFSVYDPVQGLIRRDPLYDPDYNNFAPRASVAWDLNGKGKTVVRAGVGVFYDDYSQDAFTGQIYENSFNAGLAYNPIAPSPVFVFKPFGGAISAGSPIFDTTNVGHTTDASTVDKRMRTPYVYNYNLNLQQELVKNTVLQVGYVGSAGRKLLRFRDINQPTQAEIFAFDTSCDCTSSGGVPRPLTANLSGVDPQAPFVVNQLEASALSNYNSLQVALNQRSWHGFSHQVAYTWSHSIDTASDSQDYVPNASQPQDSTNPRADKAPSNFDVRQRFVWSSTYAIPKWSKFGRMGEGWSADGVLTLMSGHPFSMNYNFIDDYSGSGEFFDRPDVAGPITYNHTDPTRFLDLSSFAVPCTFQGPNDGFADSCTPGTRHFGTLGRNALLGPDYRNFDLAISKMTALNERFKLQFRADFYNLANHPNFANPLAVAFFADAAPNRCNPALPSCNAQLQLGFNQGPGTVTAGGQTIPVGHGVGFSPLTATSDVGLGNPVLGGGGQRSIQFSIKLLF
jgi:outer membrane receptor protein involved in Fe transport